MEQQNLNVIIQNKVIHFAFFDGYQFCTISCHFHNDPRLFFAMKIVNLASDEVYIRCHDALL